MKFMSGSHDSYTSSYIISSPEDKTPSYAIFKIVQERQKTDSNIQ